jgi:hypothetical protein
LAYFTTHLYRACRMRRCEPSNPLFDEYNLENVARSFAWVADAIQFLEDVGPRTTATAPEFAFRSVRLLSWRYLLSEKGWNVWQPGIEIRTGDACSTRYLLVERALLRLLSVLTHARCPCLTESPW